MKFQTEKKKPTLCIYTDEEFVAEKLEWEVSSLRQELDGTRAALRLQAARCRHLVAAFSTQLQRQESAARRERELRDEQLSRLLRALLVLDAGLRREQRNIREQLHSKDAMIHAQQLEIAMLRGDHDVTLHVLPLKSNGEVASRTLHQWGGGNESVNSETNGDVNNSHLQTSKTTAFARFRKHSQKSISQHNKLKSKSTNVVDEHPILHRVETRGLEKLQKMASDLKDEMVGISNDDGYHDPDEELPNRNLYEDYQHNPVLECVNQILLSDLEESEEKEVGADKQCYLHAAASEPEARHVEFDARNKIDRVDDKEESKLRNENTRKWQTKDKTPSPPAKEHLEEKACLMMSSQRLTLVRNVDYEEVDKKENGEVDKNDVSQKRGIPPALPPKPSQLQLGNRIKKPSIIPPKTCNPQQGIEKCDKPHQRKILSNGSLKYPLNLDHSLQENRHNNHNSNCNGQTFEDKIDNMNITILHHNTPRGIAVMNGHGGKDHKIRSDEKMNGKIRVGSSVSSLITGAAGDSIVSELSKGSVPKVSNIVRRFEDLGTCIEEDEEEDEKGNDTLRENFEEFKLEDVDMDAVGRPEGDGAETKINGGTYEHFLESTGLSQKSIMTPSRMLSNHRSVLKPKDIKHRSRLLKAAAITNHGGSIVKYWTEPFL